MIIEIVRTTAEMRSHMIGTKISVIGPEHYPSLECDGVVSLVGNLNGLSKEIVIDCLERAFRRVEPKFMHDDPCDNFAVLAP